MSQKIIDYSLVTLKPKNPDGTCPAKVTKCVLVPGPGATALGNFIKALDFGGKGQLKAELPSASLNAKKFCVRLVFKVDTPVAARQNLVESDALPFSFYLVKGSGSSDFNLVASVATSAYGSGLTSTEHFFNLHLATWYVADLVYDTDTLAVFVNGTIYSVHAFPDGTLASGTGDQLYAGMDANGTDYPFGGCIAALQLHNDIPIELESQLDERRSHPQWYLTYKQEQIKATLNFGEPTSAYYHDLASSGWIQEFPGGIIMYHEANGQALEMHGGILQAYWSLTNRAEIGYLITDEMNAASTGSRKSLFSRGGIYWSGGTGAIPVIGQIWVDYESMGEAAAIGLPTAAAESISGGIRQVFQKAQMYLKAGTSKTFEVHGGILTSYLATGGAASWGFPVSSEQNLLSGTTVIGRVSEFEGCTIYWSSSSGAHEVHGSIRDKYRNTGGPSGDLGFPTSNEGNIPGASAPARYNTFQHGSILWFGSASETYVCLPFDINLGRVDTKESEGWLRGENDVYMQATIEDNGQVILAERIPEDGDSDGNNIYEVNKTFDLGPDGIVPNSTDHIIKFSLDIWDSDWPDDDDHLGLFEYTLDMSNAWGLRVSSDGLFNSGSFDSINSITWSVSPRIDESLLTEAQKWWGVKNASTDPLSWEQYASAFSDVDSDTEWWDPFDWLDELFYAAVVKGLAKNGNCFGMSLEAIYSKKHRSYLRLPLDRFKVWEAVRNEFNIRHQYQVGAPAIWWFVGEFLSGNTHDPVDVFRATRSAYSSGRDPVVCIAQNYDFSGAPHCILPVDWDDRTKPWKMYIHDPNFPTASSTDSPRILYVDPDANTFTYDGGSNKYSGGEWSGGRFHYMPFNLLNERPRTPVFDAILLLIAGVIIILGADGETTSLTDENGIDLDAFGSDSINRLKAGKPLTNKFVSVKGFGEHSPECADLEPPEQRPQGGQPDRTQALTPLGRLPQAVRQGRVPGLVSVFKPRAYGVLASEVHMRSVEKTFSRLVVVNKRSGDSWKNLTLREYVCQVAPAAVRRRLARSPKFLAANNDRMMHHLVDTPQMKEILGTITTPAVEIPHLYPDISPNFIHTLRSLRSGKLEYGVKHGLSQFMLTAEAAAGDQHTLQVKELGTHANEISIQSSRAKIFRLEVHNRLGVGNDHLWITIDNIPLAAGSELKINIKPGIGGVELISAGQQIKAQVKFDYASQGAKLTSSFVLQEQDGLRIVPSTFITSSQLKVVSIDKLFGETLSSRFVPPMP